MMSNVHKIQQDPISSKQLWDPFMTSCHRGDTGGRGMTWEKSYIPLVRLSLASEWKRTMVDVIGCRWKLLLWARAAKILLDRVLVSTSTEQSTNRVNNSLSSSYWGIRSFYERIVSAERKVEPSQSDSQRFRRISLTPLPEIDPNLRTKGNVVHQSDSRNRVNIRQVPKSTGFYTGSFVRRFQVP